MTTSPEKQVEKAVTADSRRVLEWLADRASKAAAVARIAEWVGLSVPRTQGALTRLRVEGFVRYFPGEPGTWAISHRGLSEGRFDSAPESPLFRMAPEAILATRDPGGAYRTLAEAMPSIAKAALTETPDAS